MQAIGLVAFAGQKIGAEIAYGGVAAAASALASLPFPANMIAAPIVGAGAIAMLTGIAAAGKTAGLGIAGRFQKRERTCSSERPQSINSAGVQ